MSKIAVVCSQGIGTSVLVARRLRVIFPEHSFEHFGLMDFKSQKYDVVVTFQSMVSSVLDRSSLDQKVRTYEGLFDALGGAGTMENRLSESSTESERIEILREYLFSDELDREDF
jgi:galactitol-specific phosphotransferase system IIB component